MATTVSIIISASAARAVAAFTAIRAGLQRLAGAASSAGKVIGNVAPYALLAGKIVAIGAAALAATGVIANLLGAIQLIAPAAAAGGLAMITLKMGLSGVQDALEAGLSGDVEEFEKALKKLEPAARDAVRMIIRLRDEWKPLQQRVQGELFAGAAGELKSLSGFIRPIAERWLPRLALKFAEVRGAIANGIAKYAADGRLEAVWINITDAVGHLLGVIEPLGRAFGDVLGVAAPSFNELSAGIENAAKKFSDWIRQARDDGSLKRWLDTAKETFGQLKAIAENVGKSIAGIFGASSNSGSTFLESAVKASEDLSNWVNSDEGQSFIEFWASLIGLMARVSPFLDHILGTLNVLSAGWSLAWDGMKSIFQGVINWILGGWEKVIRAAAAAADAMGMDSLAGKLRGAANAVAGFRDSVNESLNGIQKTVDITVNYRARMIGNHLVSGAQQSGTYSSGIGGRASGGMASGLKWVGERGRELVDFNQGRVYNSGQSERMAAQAGGGTGGLTIVVEAAPGPANPIVDLVLGLFRSGKVKLKVSPDGRVVVA